MNALFDPEGPWRGRFEKTVVFLSTGFYLSLLPPKIAPLLRQTAWGHKYLKENWTGSGLSGSVLGFLTYLLLPRFVATHFISLAIGTLFAVWMAHIAEKLLGQHDDPRIVIDEWIGCWVAMVGVPPLLSLPHRFGFEICTAFVLFRVFDVYKGPWGRRLQNLPGGWGVVMDDVLAGLIANVLTRIVVVIVGVL